MSPKFVFALPLVLALAACGTPQEQCIAAGTKDLRTVEGLVRLAQGNIARGYAYVDVVKTVPQFVDCTPDATEANPEPEVQMCLVNTATTYRQPVAIDLAAEQRKLGQLLAKRDDLARQAQSVVTACQQQYPEA